MFGFMWLVTVCLSLVEFVNRLSFISKAVSLTKLSDDPMWKVWRLSAIEPLVTTCVGLFGFWWLNSRYEVSDYIIHIATVMSISLFIVWSWAIGRQYQRGRLAISALFLRLSIISIPLIAQLFGVNSDARYFSELMIGSLFIPFVFRVGFGIYQNSVTPRRDDFLRQKAEDEIYIGRREIEDRLTLIDDIDLWDEQMALIERLKAEDGGADQWVAEKNVMVGRARELL